MLPLHYFVLDSFFKSMLLSPTNPAPMLSTYFRLPLDRQHFPVTSNLFNPFLCIVFVTNGSCFRRGFGNCCEMVYVLPMDKLLAFTPDEN